jgi:uncharacterized protein YyaL (SSP411 family)
MQASETVAAASATTATAAAATAPPSSPPRPRCSYADANTLGAAASPYLRSLTSSPVHWHPWDESLLECARELDRPLLVSLGVSWSREARQFDELVMADAELASAINRRFVPVKIDCDERPDLAERYGLFYSVVRGGTGAPDGFLVVALPDGGPFEAWPPATARTDETSAPATVAFLDQVEDIYRRQKPAAEAQVRKYVALLDSARGEFACNTTVTREALRTAATRMPTRLLAAASQPQEERREATPIFQQALLALHHYSDTRSTSSLELAQKLLTDVTRSALRDHVFGGYFHAVNGDGVPVAGKLLPDQALALQAFSQAYAATGKKTYREAVDEVLRFMLDTLEDPNGGFYSSQEVDADPAAPQAYFTWSASEIGEIVADATQREVFLRYYGFDGIDPARKCALTPKRTLQSVAGALKIDYDAGQKALDEARRQLREARYARPDFPRVNKAFIVAWNAKAISAYCDVWRYLGVGPAREFATKSAGMLLDRVTTDSGVLHYLVRGQAAVMPVMLADQVFLAAALLDCAEVSGKQELVNAASAIMDRVHGTFALPDIAGYVDLPAADSAEGWRQPLALVRDGVVESPNAIAMSVWFRLYRLTGKEEFQERAFRLAACVLHHEDWWNAGMEGYVRAICEAAWAPPKAVIVGDPAREDTQQLWREALGTFRSGKIVEVLTPAEASQTDYLPAKDGRALVYICTTEACAPPVSQAGKVRPTLLEFGREQ